MLFRSGHLPVRQDWGFRNGNDAVHRSVPASKRISFNAGQAGMPVLPSRRKPAERATGRLRLFRPASPFIEIGETLQRKS